MKIYISIDLEGLHGVTQYDDHKVNDPEYRKWKKQVSQLMKEEVLALYRGFQAKGNFDLTVFDSHGHQNTLSLSENLDGLKQVRRSDYPHQNFPGLDDTFDGIILWGYHVKAGDMRGKLRHTTSRRIQYISVNSKEVGEVFLHSLYATMKGLPILAVSGDSGLENEVKQDIGEIPFFNSEIGDQLSRELYLESIEKFILDLDIKKNISINKNISWPQKTRIEIKYNNPLVNLARLILRQQYHYAKLKGLSSCVYQKVDFIEQWDQFCGYYQKGKERSKIKD
jgi:D-amino peptidase